MTCSVSPSAIGGSIRAPGSKSSLQRALACATLAPGVSTLRAPTWSADSLASARVAEVLGASVEMGPDRAVVRGVPEISGGASNAPVFASCGESGTCMRMFSAVAALFPRVIELSGEGTLARRPMGMVVDALRSLGAECSTNGGRPPIRVRGPLRGGRVRLDGGESSQFLTGLLIALPLAQEDSVIEVDNLVSRGYVDLTLDVMRAFGVQASRNAEFTEFRVKGGGTYKPADYEVEGDWSGAAFPLVAGALAARDRPVEVTGLSIASSQPDRAILQALKAAGAEVEAVGACVRVRAAALRAFSFDATDCPDLFPPLVALASRCEGETLLTGANRLRAKESDRAAALSQEFARLGVGVAVEGDRMRVRGRAGAERLCGGCVTSRGDHRIAMAAAVAALAASEPVEISGAECVSKSYPAFFQDLAALGAQVRS